MSIDPKFVELTADVLRKKYIKLLNWLAESARA